MGDTSLRPDAAAGGLPLQTSSSIIPARLLSIRFLLLTVVLTLAACGGEGQPLPTPTSTPVPSPRTPPPRYFPVTVVVETGKTYLRVNRVTREESPKDPSRATLVIEGAVKTLSSGRFDYRLTVTDSEGEVYAASPSILLGTHEEGEDLPFTTFVTVPFEATLTRLSYWVEGAERPELSYLIDLPVSSIPLPP